MRFVPIGPRIVRRCLRTPSPPRVVHDSASRAFPALAGPVCLLAADFGNLRLRDIDSLKIDRFGVGFHIHSKGLTEKRYDDVVAATSYIGPMVPR